MRLRSKLSSRTRWLLPLGCATLSSTVPETAPSIRVRANGASSSLCRHMNTHQFSALNPLIEIEESINRFRMRHAFYLDSDVVKSCAESLFGLCYDMHEPAQRQWHRKTPKKRKNSAEAFWFRRTDLWMYEKRKELELINSFGMCRAFYFNTTLWMRSASFWTMKSLKLCICTMLSIKTTWGLNWTWKWKLVEAKSPLWRLSLCAAYNSMQHQL